MTTEHVVDEQPPVVRACGQCGHVEDDHVEEEIELAGVTVRRVYCEPCESWHEFVIGDDG